MQRINDNIGRRGFDGKLRTWQEIEDRHKANFEQEIARRFKRQINKEKKARYRKFLEWCRDHTAEWLVATPEKLRDAKIEIDNKKTYKQFLANLKFRNKLARIYGYEHKKLIELASWLNVKTCPYCNMQYTLYAEDYPNVNGIAKFQFDHFYDKAEYPMFSMSLYNLIPSCACCNLGKGQEELSLDFHPYHSAIKDTFRFRVKNPMPLWLRVNTAVADIELVPLNGCNLDKYKENFHVDALYQRHKDVAEEVFARAYEASYYKNLRNFPFLKDRKLAERLQKGFYTNEDEIELRPLTKFQQDIWEQAIGEK